MARITRAKARETTAEATDCLLPHHRQMLEQESGLTPAVIAARGYRSVTKHQELFDCGFAAYQCGNMPGLLVPLHHVDERVSTSNAARYQYRPDEPRLDAKKGRPIKYETPAGTRQCVDLPPMAHAMLLNRDVPLIVTEGAKKADAAVAHGLCCVNLSGVWCWVQSGKSDDLPDSTELADWDYIPLNGRRVEICFDSDITVKPEVKQASQRLAQFLRSRGATVVVIYLPDGPNGEKTGLDDYFARGGTAAELRTLTRRPDATIRPDGIREELPTIRVTNQQLSGEVDEAMNAIMQGNNPPRVFVQSGHLVRVVRSETVSGERVSIDGYGRDALTEHLSRVANFVNNTQQGQKSVSPPERIAKSILAMGEYPELAQIDGIVSSPVFAPNGELCETTGYNAASRLYYHAREPLALPDTTPTKANVERAVDLVFNEFLVDFPFADEASKAHALAMMLLPFMRTMVKGPTPLHLIDAPRPGTGKSLLATVIANVFEPSGVAIRSAPTDEAEWKKQITTWMRLGGSHSLIDNVRSLRSASLEAVLTSDEWSDRLLGANEEGRYPNRCVWIATANNIAGTREQLRRSVWIRLDAKTERPDERTRFKHTDLPAWVRENRPALVVAAITLIRAWIEAGCPRYRGGQAMGSFEAWTWTIGGVLETVGVEGFLANRTQFIEEADEEGSELGEFVEKWWDTHQSKPVAVTDLIGLSCALVDGLEGKSLRHSLGKMLAKYRGHIVDGKTITVKVDGKHGSRYSLRIGGGD